MIAITLDIDWAPDEMVDEIIGLATNKAIPITLFCTNPSTDRSRNSTCLRGRYPEMHELAIHPYFDHTVDYTTVLGELLQHYPDSIGFRSHNTANSWKITTEASMLGLRYESNYMLYGMVVKPFRINQEWLDYYNFPIYFMDSPTLTIPGYHWDATRLPHFEELDRKDTMFVFDFHPIILYYDYATKADYDANKPSYHKIETRRSYKRKQLEGAMRLFCGLTDIFDKTAFISIRQYGGNNALWQL